MKVGLKLYKEQHCNFSTDSMMLCPLHKVMSAFERYHTCSYCFSAKKKPDTLSLQRFFCPNTALFTYPALHSPQTAFFVAVQGLIVSSLGSQIVHGLHEEISWLFEYDLPGVHSTHSTVTFVVTRDPHCGTMPWPSGHSGQGKHSTPLVLEIVN